MLVEKLRRLPVVVLGLIAFAVIASASGVATLSVTTTQTAVDLSANNFTLDADSTVENETITKAATADTANGQTQGSAVEATTGFASANTDLTVDNFVYQFEVKESGDNAWGTTRAYKVEAFSDGSLLDTLFIKNATANAGAIEGVTVKFDLGDGSAGLPDAITVKVEKVSN